MSNTNKTTIRYEELQASHSSLANSAASGADTNDYDAICDLTAKLYLQLKSRRPEAVSGERETANRRAYLRDVTEHVQRRFDSTVNTMKLEVTGGVCERAEEAAGRGTQSRVVARLQRLFKRSQTVGDESNVAVCASQGASRPGAGHPAVAWSRSCAQQGAHSSVEDSSNSNSNSNSNSSSGNTGTGSSALSNDAGRRAPVKQADVSLCVTDLAGLMRSKRTKFSRVHAVLRRDEHDFVLEFYAPNCTNTNSSTSANATAKRVPPKHGLICRLIDTLRYTTCFELPKLQTALLMKIDIGVVYLLTTDNPAALTEWYDAIDRCCALDRSSPDRHVTLSNHLESGNGMHGRRMRNGGSTRDGRHTAGLFGEMQTHCQIPVACRDTSRRPKRSRSAGTAAQSRGASHSSPGVRAGSSASLLRGDDEESDEAFVGEQHNAAFPVSRPVVDENETDRNLRRVARRLEQMTNSTRRDVPSDEATLNSVDRYVDEEVARFAWFHGALPREEAARLVCNTPLPSDCVATQPRNGVWLVRRSESIRGQLVLTFTRNGKVKHIRMYLLADGSCSVDSYSHTSFPHVTNVLEYFATTGMVPQDHTQHPRGDLDRPFGDFSVGVPAASPNRIVLGRFVANLNRFTDADKIAFGILPPSEASSTCANAGHFVTVAPAYIAKRLLSGPARTPSVDEAPAPIPAQNHPCVPQTSTATSPPPPSSSTGSKTTRAVCNNYSFT